MYPDWIFVFFLPMFLKSIIGMLRFKVLFIFIKEAVCNNYFISHMWADCIDPSVV